MAFETNERSYADTTDLDELVRRGSIKSYEFMYCDEKLVIELPDGSKLAVTTSDSKLLAFED